MYPVGKKSLLLYAFSAVARNLFLYFIFLGKIFFIKIYSFLQKYIFKENFVARCPQLVFPCVFCPGLVKCTIFYLKMLIFRVSIIEFNEKNFKN